MSVGSRYARNHRPKLPRRHGGPGCPEIPPLHRVFPMVQHQGSHVLHRTVAWKVVHSGDRGWLCERGPPPILQSLLVQQMMRAVEEGVPWHEYEIAE